MNAYETFQQTGVYYIRNVLTPKTCQEFTKKLLELKNEKHLVYEGGENTFFGNAFGGNCDVFEQSLRWIQPRFEDAFGLNAIPANSYGRIYYNTGKLEEHVDRDPLDYTLSITLHNDTGVDWTIGVEDKLKQKHLVDVKIGDGVLFLGNKLKHWRPVLNCAENTCYANLYMHWTNKPQ
jgi:hypothetical protein